MPAELLMKPVSVLKHYRPLCFHDGSLYLSGHNRIYRTRDCGATIEHMGDLEISRIRATLGVFPLARRVLRAQVYRALVTGSGNLIASFRGGMFVVPRGSRRGWRSFAVTEGSRPVSLAYRPKGMAVWGEYFGNAQRRAIHVYGSSDEGLTWKIVYTFPAGAIRHVHGISYDPWADCFWISTGDHEQEAAVFRAAPDFSSVEPVLQGGQESRFYSIVVTSENLFFANDSPNADNYLRSYEKASGKTSALTRIDNSCFYACIAGSSLFLSTNAESPERAYPITSSCANDTRATHVWMCDLNSLSCRKILTFPVDRLAHLGPPFLPDGTFQYTNVSFPDGENTTGKLFCYLTGASGYDDCTLVYDVSAFQRLEAES